ncbi:hypothetical protein D0N36_07590 [Hymenobacter lapidiphilus]|uniref:hypothetical protein n=1 Tax=Hymenobacter sp. CCM 8763 TaxID=2303334 RepID=UPI000E355359|nr:hypothetical protein [Hymenobacter sp. CCM 8763]RFP65783.1 hypothetical protein D0N36_07590 [Hymenobacter sp. CCM 8763]
MATTSFAATLLATLAATGLLAGCCSSQNCDTCYPEGVDDVRVAFRTDTLGGSGFRRAELRDAYIVRYTGRNLTGPTDTIRQGPQPGREPLSFYGGSFGFQQLPPLPNLLHTSGTTTYHFTDYSYRVVVPATKQQFTFSELETATDPGRGCCACLRNTRRRFVFNGQYTVADGSPGFTSLTR